MLTSLPSRSPADGEALLIAAQSGRALAAAARRAGFVPLVADLFGDSDTRALAAAWRGLDGRLGLGFREDGVLAALESLAAASPVRVRGVVLGSGFERRTRLMAAIAGRFRLIGASPACVRRLKDPLDFAATLARLGIPHPAVALAPPLSGTGAGTGAWLRKRRGGSGGGHIREAAAGPGRDAYFQERVAGEAFGVAFLADGHDAQLVAVTRQWVSPGRRAPWRYGGAIEPGSLPAGLAAAVEAALRRLVPAFGLTGLASADLLVAGERWWLLEINPRPGATLDVLDRRPTPLLRRHVAAADGQLGTPEEHPAEAAGAMILYAGRTIACVPAADWPDWAADRPEPASRIAAGAPICTVKARAADAATVRTLLEARGRAIQDLIEDGKHIGDGHAQAAEHQHARHAAR